MKTILMIAVIILGGMLLVKSWHVFAQSVNPWQVSVVGAAPGVFGTSTVGGSASIH